MRLFPGGNAIASIAALNILAGCSDFSLSKTSTDPVGGGERDADTAAETGVLVEDPCEGDDAPIVEVWILGTTEDDPSGDPPTCTPLGEVSWELTQEWSTPYEGFIMNVVVAPDGTGQHAMVYADEGASTPSGALLVLDGRDGTVADRVDRVRNGDDGGTAAVGDIDGDGSPEMVTVAWDTFEVYDWATHTLHTFPDTLSAGIGWADDTTVLADVDLDGAIDIVSPAGAYTWEGARIASVPGVFGGTGFFVADLDRDGWPELVTTNGAADPLTGSQDPWAVDDPPSNFHGGPLELDGEARVFVNLGEERRGSGLAGPDASLEWTTREALTGFASGVADTTGDGVADTCKALRREPRVVCIDAHGNENFDLPIPEAVYAGGSSMADLDADGAYEILLASPSGFYIFDGHTGATLAHDPTLITMHRDSYPVTADIDGDGSAEILVVTEDSIVALGAALGRWARTRRVWNQYAYDITSVDEDGRILSAPMRGWEAYHAYRAQPSHDGERPDLEVRAVTTAPEECDDVRTVFEVDVRNRGSVDAAAGAMLTLYGRSGGDLRVVAEVALPAIAVGERLVAKLVADVADLGTLWVVDVSTEIDDCNQVNNRVEGRP